MVVSMTEDDFIQGVFAPLALHPDAFGLRDDAAKLPRLPAGERHVVTMDAAVAGKHFFAGDPPEAIAWKVLAQNVSDLSAKAAQPSVYTMSLAAPEFSDHTWFTSFAGGLAEAQAAFGMSLLGGDTTQTNGPVVISITAFGTVPDGQYKSRMGAQVGDRVFVTGTLGDAGLGLMCHSRVLELSARQKLQADEEKWLIERYLRPQPRVEAIEILRTFASASMDVSDGLLKDARRLASASECGLELCKSLPLSGAYQSAGVDDVAYWGGDDYEILFTVPEDRVSDLHAHAEGLPFAISEIGLCTDGEGVIVRDRDGQVRTFQREGYDHVAG